VFAGSVSTGGRPCPSARGESRSRAPASPPRRTPAGLAGPRTGDGTPEPAQGRSAGQRAPSTPALGGGRPPAAEPAIGPRPLLGCPGLARPGAVATGPAHRGLDDGAGAPRALGGTPRFGRPRTGGGVGPAAHLGPACRRPLAAAEPRAREPRAAVGTHVLHRGPAGALGVGGPGGHGGLPPTVVAGAEVSYRMGAPNPAGDRPGGGRETRGPGGAARPGGARRRPLFVVCCPPGRAPGARWR
jgi:hypothetical protein